MNEISKELLAEMRKKSGWREGFVLDLYEKGEIELKTQMNGRLYKFKYSPEIEYQDANGAT